MYPIKKGFPHRIMVIKHSEIDLQILADYIQRLDGGNSAGACSVMFNDIIKNKWKRVLELGVAYGYSTIPLLIACYLNKGKLISCDDKRVHKVNAWLLKFNCQFLEKHWKFIWSNDMDLKFKRKFDMIFIDTSHDYEHTADELKKFSKLTDVIYCHDYNLGGVKRAVDDFATNPGWNKKIYNANAQMAKLFKL